MAAQFLQSKGYRLLVRNWRVPQAEIDLVAAEGDWCVFVEVRSRTGVEHGHPLETIRRPKQAQLIRAAKLFIEAEKPNCAGYRFDVIAVTFSADQETSELVHIENAFQTDF